MLEKSMDTEGPKIKLGGFYFYSEYVKDRQKVNILSKLYQVIVSFHYLTF